MSEAAKVPPKNIQFKYCKVCGTFISDGGLCSFKCPQDAEENRQGTVGLAIYELKETRAE